MASINNSFINALLADITYVGGLTPGMTGVLLSGKVEVQSRMTPAIAKVIGDNFTVVTQVDSPDGLGGTGFDATVWRGNAGTLYAGKLYVSMRGTEGIQDFLADIDLAVSGNARAQLVDMVNWWLRETGTAGQAVRQITISPDLVAEQWVFTRNQSLFDDAAWNRHRSEKPYLSGRCLTNIDANYLNAA